MRPDLKRDLRASFLDMPSSSETSSILSSVDMPGRFSAARMVRSKSSPTTQVTTGDTNWDTVLEILPTLGNRHSNASAGSSHSSSKSKCATRTHGLLTPHPSFGDDLAERSSGGAGSSKTSTTSSDDRSRLGEIAFVTPEGFLTVDELDLSNTPRPRAPESSTSSMDHGSYTSVGVQTSLPYTASSYLSTAPPSPVSPTLSLSVTPKTAPKRKRKSVPEYIQEGERQAKELDDDLTYLAQEKRHLKSSLSRVVRCERQLKSLLIPWPEENSAKISNDNEDDETDEEAESSRRVRFRGQAPLTPANSDHEKDVEPQIRPAESPAVTSPAVSSSSKHTSTSGSTYTGANSHPSNETTTSGSRKSSASNGNTLRVPKFTFGEGSSTTNSTISSPGDAWRTHEEALGLAPNPIRDPSTYLIWFDLETTDAVLPASKIRILEVAVLITDKNYQYLDKGKSFLVHWPLNAEEIALEMPQRVRDMHEKSGLLAAYASTPPKERFTLSQVEHRVIKYLERHEIEANGRAVMAGAGIAFDRGMVRQHMEKLNAYFSHQIFDTTTLWHAVRRKYNRTKRFSITCVHRALDDIMESSREAKLYSELILKSPGEVHWPTQSSRGI